MAFSVFISICGFGLGEGGTSLVIHPKHIAIVVHRRDGYNEESYLQDQMQEADLKIRLDRSYSLIASYGQ